MAVVVEAVAVASRPECLDPACGIAATGRKGTARRQPYHFANFNSIWRCKTRAYGEPLVAKSPELGFIPTPPPSTGGVLARLVVSSDIAHLRVWDVSWGNVPLVFLRCFGAGVPSYLAGRGSLGAFPWFVPLTLWWVHCNTFTRVAWQTILKSVQAVPKASCVADSRCSSRTDEAGNPGPDTEQQGVQAHCMR